MSHIVVRGMPRQEAQPPCHIQRCGTHLCCGAALQHMHFGEGDFCCFTLSFFNSRANTYSMFVFCIIPTKKWIGLLAPHYKRIKYPSFQSLPPSYIYLLSAYPAASTPVSPPWRCHFLGNMQQLCCMTTLMD